MEKTENKSFTLKFQAMKNRLLRFAILVIFLMGGSFTFAVPPDTESHEYEISPLAVLHFGKSIEKAWTLNYSKNEPVTITLRSKGSGKEYLVRSQYFEVLYASDNEGFGVRKVPASLKEIPDEITSSVLNKKQMESQRILTPAKVSDEYALELIATYLPDLLNESYRHVIY
jgi:hypothetical protein